MDHDFYIHVIEAFKKFRKVKVRRLYDLMRNKFYNTRTESVEEAVYPIIGNMTGLAKYCKVYYDYGFCTLQLKGYCRKIHKSDFENYVDPDIELEELRCKATEFANKIKKQHKDEIKVTGFIEDEV